MNWQFGEMRPNDIEWFREKTKRVARTPTEYHPGSPLRERP
ncbi:hypothetical protein DFP91_5888 [Pseudorhodoplanes sinuspersici]|nr:hypothetical protein DFP91_5888 [Pseudorhodoplanes sinuspersici]